MSEAGAGIATGGDRRRVERRGSYKLSEMTLPEFRRIVLTSTLFVVVLVLFLWMVRTVIIGAILGVIAAIYLRPLYEWIHRRVRQPSAASFVVLTIVTIPIVATLVYSYLELEDAFGYLQTHQVPIAHQIDTALRRIPFLAGASLSEQILNWVSAASNYGSRIVTALKAALVDLSVSLAIFYFTAWYVFTNRAEIGAYVRDKIPPRYSELASALQTNVQGVLYGAIYATLVTQTIKSIVILGMNLLFGVPLAVVLAILSFIIGFFPIVGSWSVYLPVALWLGIFRDAWILAAIMIVVGFFLNTLFISMYVRPKIAAEKSRVLDFYWMFVALVTGVYTFGIVGILLGPMVIGLLKAVLDTVTARTSWRLIESESEEIPMPAGSIITSESSIP